MKKTRKAITIAAVALTVIVLLALLANLALRQKMEREYNTSHDHNSYIMNTLVNQSAYGPAAEKAMALVAQELLAFEQTLSLFDASSEIAAINAAAGTGELVEISWDTAELLHKSQALSEQSQNSFAVTIAPLTLAWGITTQSPRVVPQAEIDALLPTIDDEKLVVVFDADTHTGHARLTDPGMGIDLGGIAKGDACRIAKNIYDFYGIESAYISIGGNIYARGTKPNGTPWRIGFRTPEPGSATYIASFEMTDEVIAVSGGYERFFETNGESYIHILDPRTGAPAKSDIASIGVIHADGATSDFYSTSLFVLGKDIALDYMRDGITCILLDEENNLYVSASLQGSFQLAAGLEGVYNLEFVEGS